MTDKSADTPIIETADWSKLPADPLVSVHMLAYRHEKFIAQAIEGVIAQRCDFPFELIIGEDCSPDGTLEIARAYQARYPQLIRVVTGPYNVGMHKNAQRCGALCRGKYIALCEGDDFWHDSKKLQMQVDLMESNPAMVLCHTDFDRMTRFRTKRSVHRSKASATYPAQGNAYESLLLDWSVMTATALYRRDIVSDFTRTPFYTHEWPFGDRNLMLYASLRGTVGYIDKSTATFRKMLGSASNSGLPAKLRMAIANRDCIQLFLSSFPVDKVTAYLSLMRMHRWVYLAALRNRNLQDMDDAFLWLSQHGFGPSRNVHFLCRMAVKAKFPIVSVEFVRTVLDRYMSAM